MNTTVRLLSLEESEREQFIIENQRAFNYGAMEEFGLRNNHFEEEKQIIAHKTIEQSIDSGEAYHIVADNKKVGGVVVKVDGDKGELELLFVSPEVHSKGIGYAAWCEIEKNHPDPNDLEMNTEDDEQFPVGMFRFEKVIR